MIQITKRKTIKNPEIVEANVATSTVALADDNTYKSITEAEITRLLSVITSTRDLCIFTLAYNHGMRASEVGLIQYPGDLNLPQAQMLVKRVKKGLNRVHPLNNEEVKLLKKWINIRGEMDGALFLSRQMRPIGRRMLDRLMKHYGKRAGLSDDACHFHVLRHSCATHMIAADIHQVKIQKWLGHRDLSSTLIYAEVADLRDTGKEFFDFVGRNKEQEQQGKGRGKKGKSKDKEDKTDGRIGSEKRAVGKIRWKDDMSI